MHNFPQRLKEIFFGQQRRVMGKKNRGRAHKNICVKIFFASSFCSWETLEETEMATKREAVMDITVQSTHRPLMYKWKRMRSTYVCQFGMIGKSNCRDQGSTCMVSQHSFKKTPPLNIVCRSVPLWMYVCSYVHMNVNFHKGHREMHTEGGGSDLTWETEEQWKGFSDLLYELLQHWALSPKCTPRVLLSVFWLQRKHMLVDDTGIRCFQCKHISLFKKITWWFKIHP